MKDSIVFLETPTYIYIYIYIERRNPYMPLRDCPGFAEEMARSRV